jgi:hypothetical protein
MSSVRPFKTSTYKILQSWSSVVKLLVWWLVYSVTECHGVKTYHTLWTVLSCLNGEPGAWILDDVGRTTKACHFWGLRSRSVLVWKGWKVICSVSVSSERKGFWCVADHAFMPSVCRCRHCAPQLRGSLVVWHEAHEGSNQSNQKHDRKTCWFHDLTSKRRAWDWDLVFNF